jgi:hypothetical protein
MRVVYAVDEYPTEDAPSIFLAGPTPRSKEVKSWRPEAIDILAEERFNGQVFVPEGRWITWHSNYEAQVEWEEKGLILADCISFWIPRVMETMPALTTNDEWGTWKKSGKVVLGAPPEAVKVRYQRYYATKYGIPQFDTLRDTLRAAIQKAISRSAK